jgi:hypothetical protein
VLRILGSKARCHTISIHLLLVASTTQGVAPDRHGLGSLKAWHVLWSIPISSESTGDEDDAPEEWIEATAPNGGSVSRLLAGHLKHPTALTVRAIAFDSLLFCCPRGDRPTPDRLSIVLCRFTC